MKGATVVSTSTRNFPNRLGKNTNVFLASAELAAIASKLGKIPTVAEYHEAMGIINKDAASVYRYELRPDRGRCGAVLFPALLFVCRQRLEKLRARGSGIRSPPAARIVEGEALARQLLGASFAQALQPAASLLPTKPP